MKIELPGSITIAAPAASVWQVIVHDYATIAQWSSAIPHSTPLSDLPALTNLSAVEDAPVSGRACSATVPDVKTVHEQFLYYDEAQQRFGYAAVAGLPPIIRHAENHWAVESLTAESSRFAIRCVVELADWLGYLLAPLLKWQLNRTGRFTLEELKYYIETGHPHPRKAKQRQTRYTSNVRAEQ